MMMKQTMKRPIRSTFLFLTVLLAGPKDPQAWGQLRRATTTTTTRPAWESSLFKSQQQVIKSDDSIKMTLSLATSVDDPEHDNVHSFSIQNGMTLILPTLHRPQPQLGMQAFLLFLDSPSALTKRNTNSLRSSAFDSSSSDSFHFELDGEHCNAHVVKEDVRKSSDESSSSSETMLGRGLYSLSTAEESSILEPGNHTIRLTRQGVSSKEGVEVHYTVMADPFNHDSLDAAADRPLLLKEKTMYHFWHYRDNKNNDKDDVLLLKHGLVDKSTIMLPVGRKGYVRLPLDVETGDLIRIQNADYVENQESMQEDVVEEKDAEKDCISCGSYLYTVDNNGNDVTPIDNAQGWILMDASKFVNEKNKGWNLLHGPQKEQRKLRVKTLNFDQQQLLTNNQQPMVLTTDGMDFYGTTAQAQGVAATSNNDNPASSFHYHYNRNPVLAEEVADMPSDAPSLVPSEMPSMAPSLMPSDAPSLVPTIW